MIVWLILFIYNFDYFSGSKKNNRLHNIEIQVSNNSNMDFVLVLVNPDENSDSSQCIENRMADSSSERENTSKNEKFYFLKILLINVILFYTFSKFQTKIISRINVKSVNILSHVMLMKFRH